MLSSILLLHPPFTLSLYAPLGGIVVYAHIFNPIQVVTIYSQGCQQLQIY